MEINKKNIPHVFVYLGFLTTAISVPKEDFIVHRFAYALIVAAMIYFFVYRKLFFNKQIVMIFLSILLLSCVSVLKGSATFYLVIRTFAGLLAIHMALFSYYIYYDFDYKIIIRHYIIIAIVSCYVGIFQEISYMAGFVPGYDFSWFLVGLRTQVIADMSAGGPMMRISSFFSEPGYFAAALTPAGFLAIHNFMTGSRVYMKRFEAVVIFIAMMLTFSTIGYIGMILSLLFNIEWKIFRKVFISIFCVSILLFFTMSNIDFFRSRAVGIWSAFIEKSLTGHENASSLVLAVNYNIAKDNFIKHPFIGSGLDSFQIVSRNSLDSFPLDEGLRVFVNSMDEKDMRYEDGSTMYFRIITELGLIGICFLIWFFYKFNVKYMDPSISLLQNMCLVFLLIYGLRTGQYIRFELWYFIGLYYCLYKYYTLDKDFLISLTENKFTEC